MRAMLVIRVTRMGGTRDEHSPGLEPKKSTGGYHALIATERHRSNSC